MHYTNITYSSGEYFWQQENVIMKFQRPWLVQSSNTYKIILLLTVHPQIYTYTHTYIYTYIYICIHIYITIQDQGSVCWTLLYHNLYKTFCILQKIAGSSFQHITRSRMINGLTGDYRVALWLRKGTIGIQIGCKYSPNGDWPILTSDYIC